ncbi:hypothetical protein I4U23_000170 [Adineta vaga]|nr:hypothetical protein I4U23_000170 [Adineta vaga]
MLEECRKYYADDETEYAKITLYNQLAHVYNTETVHSQPIREVYRGQMLRTDELQKLKDSVGGEYQTALEYLQKTENSMLLNVSLTDFWLKNIFETIGDTCMKRAEQKFNSQKDYELAIINYKIILGSADEEVMLVEISYKLFKACCNIDDHSNGEYFGEVLAVGVNPRTANTFEIRKNLFSWVNYLVEGAFIPDRTDICRRCDEFAQLTNDKEKKLICCKFVTDMCLSLYPSLYDILLFSHKYNLLIDSEFEHDYSEFFVFQENIAFIELSNMLSSLPEQIRTCMLLVHLAETLRKRLKFEELDELFSVQMMDLNKATLEPMLS